MQEFYWRPITGETGPLLAGGWAHIASVERLTRSGTPERMPLDAAPTEVAEALTTPRPPLAGLTMDRPRIMGILNVTPDSFSDGGRHNAPDAAIAHARTMVAQGAGIIDIGGESTRPGATPVPVAEEIARTRPVIAALAGEMALSIDTRNAACAREAMAAGAEIFNDVTALTHDRDALSVAAETGASLCLMHALGDPRVMQDDPRYDNVLLDIYDYLSDRVAVAEAAGIPRSRITVDPGIGFGKTLDHNLTLLRNISLFHGLGCPVLLGASRKRFIGALSGAQEAADRMPGSLAVTLAAIDQGVQIHRVHDVAAIAQGMAVHAALAPVGAQM